MSDNKRNIQLPTPVVCDRFASGLKAYQDGQLGWWARRNVERHLAHCAECRKEMQAMREFSDVLREGDAEPLSPQLRARILAAVPDTPTPLTSTPIAARTLRRPVLAWGAAASALIVGVVLYPLYRQNSPVATDSAPLSAAKSSAAGESTAKNAAEEKTEKAASGMSAPAAVDANQPKAKAPAQIAMGPKTDAAGGMPGGAARPYNPESEPVNADIAAPGGGKAARMVPAPTSASANIATMPSAPASSGSAVSASHNARAISPPAPNPAPAQKHEAAGVEGGPGAVTPTGRVTSGASAAGRSRVKDKSSPRKYAAATKGAAASSEIQRFQPRSTPDSNKYVLVVTDVEQSQAAINRAVAQNGGLVSGVKSPGDKTSGEANADAVITVTLKLPPDRRRAFVSQLGALGELKPGAGSPRPNEDGKSDPAPGSAASFGKTEAYSPGQPQNSGQFRPRGQTNEKTTSGKTASGESGKASHTRRANTSRPWTQLTIHLRQR